MPRSSRSKGRIKVIPTRSNSISLRNSKQRETFVSLDSTNKKRKDRATRSTVKDTHQEKLPAKSLKVYQLNEIPCKNDVKESAKKDDTISTMKPNNTKKELSSSLNTNENSKNVVGNEELSLVTNLPVKRKRGRPRKSETITQQTRIVEPLATKEAKKERTPSPPCLKQEDSPPPSPPARRKPRMASLNAIAKVNAVLENYRFEKIKSNLEKQSLLVNNRQPNNDKKENVEKNSFKPIKNHLKHVEMKLSKKEDAEIDIEELDDTTQEKDQPHEDNVFTNPVSPEQNSQSIQTETYHYSKSVQTEVINFPSINSASLIETICTCSRSEKRFVTPLSSSDFPVHVRSTVLAKTPAHTVAIPIIKNHICSQTNEVYKGITDNISFLLDQCLNRTLYHKTNYPDCNKLRKISEQKESLDNKRRLTELKHQRLEQKKNAQRLVIPSLDCEPISISIPVSGTYRNGLQSSKKPATKKVQKLKVEEIEGIMNKV